MSTGHTDDAQNSGGPDNSAAGKNHGCPGSSGCPGNPRSPADPRDVASRFPYGWREDDLVSRRELLRFTVYASGALFLASAGLAALSTGKGPAPPGARLVARKMDVAQGEALYFRYPGDEDEAVLLRLPGDRYVAFSQRCTHLSCSVVFQADRARLYCPCHEGAFNPETGDPIAGPPRRRLARILLHEDGDALYAVGVMP